MSTNTPSVSSRPDPESVCAGQRGFGLVDLVCTLALCAVIAAIAVPSAMATLRTYHRNGAARELLAQIRNTQQLAVTRRGVYGFHWHGDPTLNGPTSEYRIVRDANRACSFPAEGATEDGTSVVLGWRDLQDQYGTVTIQSIKDSGNTNIGGVMFDPRGASVNTCAAVSYPIRVTVRDDRGTTRVIEIGAAGATKLL